MTENNSNFIDIKRDNYSIPTQVRWGETNDAGQTEEYFGIAYQDKLICGCGAVIDLNDEEVYVFEEFDWMDISKEIEGI